MSDEHQTELPAVRPLTAQIFDALMLDIWPSHATCQDFGLTSGAHYTALQAAVKAGEPGPTLVRLEQIIGRGPKLTAFVRETVPDAPKFTTPFDTLLDEGEG
ncbi:MAG: hypothetical protein HGA45_27580 [Chloroflexales bacterium]|nr:hypothetical protein [Chloroflexales bacterium]